MFILSVETSCDETAFAVGKITDGKLKLLSNTVLSQAKIHEKFGGVVPNLAARKHLENFEPLLKVTLEKAKISLGEVDVFSVVSGPGLIPALLVGVNIAKTLAYYWQKPLLPVHHVEGHIYAAWFSKSRNKRKSGKLRDIKFPVLALVVSGGHTQLILMKDHLDYRVVGETLDDAVGEAFDKSARLLGLSYPGGRAISKLARRGNKENLELPRPLINSGDFSFSFSGLKTAIFYLIEDLKKEKKLTGKVKADLAAAFEKAAVEVLIKKTEKAMEKYRPKSLVLAGGVAANKILRKKFQALENKKGGKTSVSVYVPDLKFCSDNAAMQLPAVYWRLKKKGKEFYKNGWKMAAARAVQELK